MRLFRFILVVIILGCVTGVYAQKGKESAKKKHKEQLELQDQRKAKIEGEMQAKRSRHQDIQTKATRKRMKQTARKSKRLREGKSIPWYRRWFGRR